MWSAEKAEKFWANRRAVVIGVIDDLTSDVNSMLERRRKDEQDYAQDKLHFVNKHNITIPATTVPTAENKEVSDLTFWMKYNSWTYCPRCASLSPKKLLPSYRRRSTNKPLANCPCEHPERYMIPSVDDIPVELRGLSRQRILALRPLIVFAGGYNREQHGYRVKDGMFYFPPDPTPVVQKIDQLLLVYLLNILGSLLEVQRTIVQRFYRIQSDKERCKRHAASISISVV